MSCVAPQGRDGGTVGQTSCRTQVSPTRRAVPVSPTYWRVAQVSDALYHPRPLWVAGGGDLFSSRCYRFHPGRGDRVRSGSTVKEDLSKTRPRSSTELDRPGPPLPLPHSRVSVHRSSPRRKESSPRPLPGAPTVHICGGPTPFPRSPLVPAPVPAGVEVRRRLRP